MRRSLLTLQGGLSAHVPARESCPAWAPCDRSVLLFTCTVCPPGFPYEKVVQRVLYLQVLDYDRFSRNDPIGEVSIPLNKVDLTQMQTFWKDLKPCSDGSVRPYLQVPGWAANRPGPGCCPVTKSCLTLRNPMACSPPVFPVLHYLPEFAQTHLH